MYGATGLTGICTCKLKGWIESKKIEILKLQKLDSPIHTYVCRMLGWQQRFFKTDSTAPLKGQGHKI